MGRGPIERSTRPRSEPARSVAGAVVGTALVTAYASLAALQILWLNPLAVAAEVQTESPWADVTAAGESFNTPLVVGVLSIGPIFAVVALVAVARNPAMTPPATALIYLVLLALGAFGYFAASFGPGMALADTYLTTGGDRSPWAIPLYVTSLMAIVLITIGSIATLVRAASR